MIEESKLEDDWKPAYDLRTWEEFPGDIAASIVLGRIDFGKKKRGPTQESSDEAQYLRSAVRNNAQIAVSQSSKTIDREPKHDNVDELGECEQEKSVRMKLKMLDTELEKLQLERLLLQRQIEGYDNKNRGSC